jgi:hypothetical protein
MNEILEKRKLEKAAIEAAQNNFSVEEPEAADAEPEPEIEADDED